MNFCQECGASLFADARFCESCGSKVHEAGDGVMHARPAREVCLTVFNGGAWRERWGNAEALYLEKQLGSYLTSRGSISNVRYEILDLSKRGIGACPSFDEVLGEIEGVAGKINPRYLFLIGGHEELPMALYTDPTPHDQDIGSDHGYAALSNRDFGDGNHEVSMASRFLVGRLPIGVGASLDELQTYFRNALDYSAWAGDRAKKVFAATCTIWEPASKAVAQSLGGPLVLTSPALNHEQLHAYLGAPYDCLYFNVHGSSNNPSWWGQGLNLSPEVAKPENFRQLPSINIISSEACYGARFEGLPHGESAMMTCLYHRSLGFFGSTRIAYGPAEVPNWGADTVVREFLQPFCGSTAWQNIGISLGEAAGNARFSLAHDFGIGRPDLLPILLKTFLEFNLFGDPTLFANSMGEVSKIAPVKSADVDMPDTSTRIDRALLRRSGELFGRIETGLSRISSEVRTHIDRRIASLYPEYAGVVPVERSYRSGGEDHYLLTYYFGSDSSSARGIVTTCSSAGEMGPILFMK